jgi:hypothetical protein
VIFIDGVLTPEDEVPRWLRHHVVAHKRHCYMTGIFGMVGSGNAFAPVLHIFTVGTAVAEAVPLGATNVLLETGGTGGGGGGGFGSGCPIFTGGGGGSGAYSRCSLAVSTQVGHTFLWTSAAGTFTTGATTTIAAGTITGFTTITCPGGSVGATATGGGNGTGGAGAAIATNANAGATNNTGVTGQAGGSGGAGGTGVAGININSGSGGVGGFGASNTFRTVGVTGSVAFSWT